MLRVLKLGGSLFGKDELPGWLEALSQARGQVVVVPGGGPFADAVRAAQARLSFPDATAHHMALLAMEQFGLALCGLERGLRPAASARAISDAISHGYTPVWLPTAMSLHAPGIPEDWSVTSDSLAAWLASVLGADALGLVKHGPQGIRGFNAATDEHLMDAAFPVFAAAYGRPISLLGHDDPRALMAWLESAST